MTPPTFRAEHGAYLFEWPDEALRLEIDRVRTERSGDIAGEIAVRSTEPVGLIHHARINLSGTRSRAELAKHLASRTPGRALDWPSMVEFVSVKTIAAFRQGDPAVLLRDIEPPEDDGFLLEPLVPARHPMVLFGDGGSGKSYLALAAAVSIHTGRELLGMTPSVRRRVAYLDFEYDGWEHRRRLAALLGSDADLPDLVYVRCSLPLRDDVDRLRRIVREHAIEYVVVDSVAPACGGEPESAEVALGYFGALRQLGLGSLSVAHNTKSGDEYRPFGSTFWHNLARSTWFVRGQQEAGNLDLAAFHRKNNAGPLSPPLSWRVTFGHESTTFEATALGDNPELAASLPARQRLVLALEQAGRPMTYAELTEETGLPDGTVRSTVHRHSRDLLRTEMAGRNVIELARRQRP